MTFVISSTAFLAALLTLLSGFGLGTILMPVVAIFFPITVAVAMTAFVHLLNNMLKLALLWRKVYWPVVWQFGIPALAATIPGALLLTHLSVLPELHAYKFMGAQAVITPVKLIVGLLLIVFATLEWLPVLKNINLSSLSLLVGGVMSGFFGGLSGHQGAFRSLFLIHAGLDKNQFVGSNAAISALVDITRLVVYGLNVSLIFQQVNMGLLAAAATAAFAGVAIGTVSIQKITMGFILKLVAGTLYVAGILLILGLL